MAKKFMVAPSILAADFSILNDEIKKLEAAGADWLHVDVMDGHFVPNLTIGAPVVSSLRPRTKLPLDVHLMIDNPEKYLVAFQVAGADYLTIHVETVSRPKEVLTQIRELGMKPGITLKPSSPLQLVLPYLDIVDLVLVMTVDPGFGGQSFMEDQVVKIKQLREAVDQLDRKVLIEVDGGVNNKTAEQCVDADVLVAGSYVFKNNYKDAIAELKKVKR